MSFAAFVRVLLPTYTGRDTGRGEGRSRLGWILDPFSTQSQSP